jgi:hypothetical protein
VVESTGFVLPGTGTGNLVVTANAGVTTAPNGDILTADGLGNAQDSGVLITALTNAVVKNPTGNQTITTNSLLPASANTTQSLGLSGSRWAASLGTTDAMSLNGVLNATDFPGADIGAQVNNAVAALGTSGGQIYIPTGTYTFSTTIYLPPHVRLSGASATGTILVWAPTSGWAIVIAELNSLFNNFGYQGALEDMTLYGPGSATATGAVYFGGSDGALPGSGTVNTSGTAVTSETGTGFSATWVAGTVITIHGLNYEIASVNSPSSITLAQSAGTQTGVAYYFVGSPLVANNPSNQQCWAFNINRVRIVQVSGAGTFGVGFQWGYNAWSQTFNECTVQGTGIGGILFPASIGTHNTGENICIIGTIISNNYGQGIYVQTGYEVNVSVISCSLDQNTGFAVVNCTSTGGNTVNLTDCYIFSEQQWILNHAFMSLIGPYFNGGTVVSTYLMDNEGVFVVVGGVLDNSGTGTYMKSGSLASTWIGVLTQGTDAANVNATTVQNYTGLFTKYNGVLLQGSGIPSEAFSTNLPNQEANYAGGAAVTIAATAGIVRISYSQAITQAATSSSTFPSLTLAWHDVNGISRTKVLVATSATNTTAVEADGVTVITSNGAAVTVTSASYASAGLTPMAYDIAIVAEIM